MSTLRPFLVACFILCAAPALANEITLRQLEAKIVKKVVATMGHDGIRVLPKDVWITSFYGPHTKVALENGTEIEKVRQFGQALFAVRVGGKIYRGTIDIKATLTPSLNGFLRSRVILPQLMNVRYAKE